MKAVRIVLLALGGTTVALAARHRHNVRLRRNLDIARLGAKVSTTYAGTAARKVFAGAERRIELDRERELKTAEAIAERLGNMKGALMKLGQMASYVDEGLPGPLREALAQLQSNAPPMSAELAAGVIERELGAPPEQVFLEWDPVPLASASIGQVHRAVVLDPTTGLERAVAVKVQYPGVGDSIAADLSNADMLGAILKQGFGGLNPDDMVAEIKERITDELDYALEARNQAVFAEHYRDHPFIHIPEVLPAFCTSRVLTTELVNGHTWAEVLTWSQEQRDLVGETLFRFVFRSLYGMRLFNGDPHPGNYLFRPGGRISFLDYGLCKRFTDDEVSIFERMIRAMVLDRDIVGFQRVVEDVGILAPGLDVPVEDLAEYFGHFYEFVMEDRVLEITPEWSSQSVRAFFDLSGPHAEIMKAANLPPSMVVIQRINLGLFALFGDLGARGNWRRIAEELWPFVDGPPSTPMGEAIAEWATRRS
jgi:predicted unusual protein kinase regulating ubiquinone biosynthesis (AarF/ABC1/UbiB family)